MGYSYRRCNWGKKKRFLSTANWVLLALPDDFDDMPPPSLNSSAVLSAVNGNSSLNATSQNKQYVFTPVGLDVKLTISVLFALAAAVGLTGNLCVLRFTNNEEKKPVRARQSSNLNFFIRSLALSDVLGSLIGAPFVLAQINSNALMTEMGCKVSRYFQTLFILITIYNLVVISVERYICTCRPTFRPLSLKTVKKAVKGAWVFGVLAALVFSYPVELIRIDLDSTRYTLTCAYNYDDPASKVAQGFRSLFTYVLPSIILVVTCTCIARMLWVKKVDEANTSNESEVNRTWRQRRKKVTTQLTVIIIALIVPYLSFFIIHTLKAMFNPSVDFKRDYASRIVATLLIYLNSPINFVIHLKHLTGFRRDLKGYFVCCDYEYEVEPVENISVGRVGEPKGTAERGDWESERRRASMSQVDEPGTRREAQTNRRTSR